MELNKTEKMANVFCDKVREKFGTRVDGFCILDVIDDPNHRAFSVIFEAYNYFPISMNYDNGRFGCCIVYEERGVSLENSQKWWENADFQIFLDELQQEIELRIPDKYLEKKGWK
ncbi:MAG: hypothetical protein RR646_06285 [Erysipelotrichaceae bacterium]